MLQSSVTKLSAEDGKDDDDDNDDDDDEKLVQDADPERLKAFNVSKMHEQCSLIVSKS